MLRRQADIPVTLLVIESGTEVEAGTRRLGLGKGRVGRLLQIDTGAVERLANETALQTNAEGAAKEPLLIGILKAYFLMGEEADDIVHHLHAGAVVGLDEVKGHVGTDEHCLGIVFKARQRHVVGTADVQLRILAGCRRIKRRLRRPVMAERRIVLRL